MSGVASDNWLQAFSFPTPAVEIDADSALDLVSSYLPLAEGLFTAFKKKIDLLSSRVKAVGGGALTNYQRHGHGAEKVRVKVVGYIDIATTSKSRLFKLHTKAIEAENFMARLLDCLQKEEIVDIDNDILGRRFISVNEEDLKAVQDVVAFLTWKQKFGELQALFTKGYQILDQHLKDLRSQLAAYTLEMERHYRTHEVEMPSVQQVASAATTQFIPWTGPVTPKDASAPGAKARAQSWHDTRVPPTTCSELQSTQNLVSSREPPNEDALTYDPDADSPIPLEINSSQDCWAPVAPVHQDATKGGVPPHPEAIPPPISKLGPSDTGYAPYNIPFAPQGNAGLPPAPNLSHKPDLAKTFNENTVPNPGNSGSQNQIAENAFPGLEPDALVNFEPGAFPGFDFAPFPNLGPHNFPNNPGFGLQIPQNQLPYYFNNGWAPPVPGAVLNNNTMGAHIQQAADLQRSMLGEFQYQSAVFNSPFNIQGHLVPSAATYNNPTGASVQQSIGVPPFGFNQIPPFAMVDQNFPIDPMLASGITVNNNAPVMQQMFDPQQFGPAFAGGLEAIPDAPPNSYTELLFGSAEYGEPIGALGEFAPQQQFDQGPVPDVDATYEDITQPTIGPATPASFAEADVNIGIQQPPSQNGTPVAQPQPQLSDDAILNSASVWNFPWF
ncbi:hypothetical protein TWF481_010767 [Arthrobotrys musiformis]|uniref:ENTH domain-containing protein n=1 Tax=Arthrobotrys musiformis TaxID=47236 RepID=A0AAV9W428_9PEZI